MLKFKGIRITTNKVMREKYVTSSTADKIVDYAVAKYNLEEPLYPDGRRHIGTEFSKIYKSLYPSLISSDELMYIELTPKVVEKFAKEGITWSAKRLLLNEKGPMFTQVVSLRMLAIYLGKLKLADEYIEEILEWLGTAILRIDEDKCVPGNKPIKIEGKPLVRLLDKAKVDKEIVESNSVMVSEGGIEFNIPKSYSMDYVKTGTLMRRDIYVIIKALAASEKIPMYEVIEEIILGKRNLRLSMLNYK